MISHRCVCSRPFKMNPWQTGLYGPESIVIYRCLRLTTRSVDPEVQSVRPKLSPKKVWRLLQTAWARCMLIFLGMDGFQASYRPRKWVGSQENGPVEHPATVGETFTKLMHCVSISLHCIRALVTQSIVRILDPYIANSHSLSVWWRDSRRRRRLHR